MTSLNLASSGLIGSIPTTLWQLGPLTAINLRGNKLSGSVPSTLAYLSGSLTSFDASSNSISGSIPTSLGSIFLTVARGLSSNNFCAGFYDLVNATVIQTYASANTTSSALLNWQAPAGISAAGLSCIAGYRISYAYCYTPNGQCAASVWDTQATWFPFQKGYGVNPTSPSGNLPVVLVASNASDLSLGALPAAAGSSAAANWYQFVANGLPPQSQVRGLTFKFKVGPSIGVTFF